MADTKDTSSQNAEAGDAGASGGRKKARQPTVAGRPVVAVRPRVVIESAQLARGGAGAPVLSTARPIVVERKRRKKRYSRRTRDFQRFERDATRSTRRVADAVASAWQTYDEESERSARRKRDGAVRDVWQNSALAVGDFLTESSRAPYDLVRNLDGDWFWRQARTVIGGLFPVGWTR